jgi:hypothetical protein
LKMLDILHSLNSLPKFLILIYISFQGGDSGVPNI